jgi:hypothetical protein
LGELGLHAYFANRAPSFEDYSALAPRLLELKPPGVPVLASPAWAEPLLRQAAPEAFPLAELARPDDRGFARYLEVSLGGSWPFGAEPELSRLPVESEHEVGPFRLRLLKNSDVESTRHDFTSALERGEVEVATDVAGELTPCPSVEARRARTGGLHGAVARPRRYHACTGERAVAVTVIEDQNYRPRRCILIEAPSRGSVELVFRGVPPSAKLVGFAGFSYFLDRDAPGAQVELSLAEGGQPLGAQRVEAARGWQRFEVQRPAAGGDVTLRASWLVEQPRELCVALEAR